MNQTNIDLINENVGFLDLFIINDSIHCVDSPTEHMSQLLTFYRIIGLILGPVNAILNGICVHIFNHSSWKKSVMSRILKGLSIIELGMGFSLFLHALIFSQDSSEPLISNSSLPLTSSHSTNNNVTNNHAYIITITSFIFMTIFSRFLVAFQVARNWSVVLLAAYRYDQICRPIGTPSAFAREHIRYILWTIFLLSCLIVLPRVFESRIIVCRTTGSVSHDLPLLTQYKLYLILYLGVIMFIVQSGGPVICVCVLSTFVIRIIIKRRQFYKQKEQNSAKNILRRQTIEYIQTKSSNTITNMIVITDNDNNNNNNNNPDIILNHDKNQINNSQSKKIDNANQKLIKETVERSAPSGDKLIFAVCITFFILETPAFFSKILNPYLEIQYPLIDLLLSVIANLLIYLDSTLNAFVYMASNPQFRKIAHEDFLKHKKHINCFKSLINITNHNNHASHQHQSQQQQQQHHNISRK